MSAPCWLALWCLLLPAASALAENDGQDEGVSLVAEATLGVNIHVLSSPFDDPAVAGFFDQWRYIDKSNGTPYYLNLFHLDVGLQRRDESYSARFEFWNPNRLNDRGVLELGWRGLGLELNHRRWRGDWLRFFPSGTMQGMAGTGYGSNYVPDTMNDEIFDSNRRFGLTRKGMDGALSLDFDEMGWDNPVLEKLTFYGDYQVRKGHRQDSHLATQTPGGFRGDRREIDQEVTSVGLSALVFPFEAFTAKLDVKLQHFSERAPQRVDETFLGDVTFLSGPTSPYYAVPHFVPDTNRITGRIDVSRRWKKASLALGGFATRVEQTGDTSPLQSAPGVVDRNAVTSYSVWSSFAAELPGILDLTGHVKWTHRENGTQPAEFFAIQRSSPYVRSTGRLKANLELGVRPVRGTRAALGFRSEYTHRRLSFGGDFDPGGFFVQPGASAVRPESLHNAFYLAARTRPVRGLQLQGELGFDWGSQTAYPNEFEEAIYFEGRGSYTLPVSLPVVFSFSTRVSDGESSNYEFAGRGTSRDKKYERLAWNYDATATVVPTAGLSLFTTFAQHRDDQQFSHLRATGQRRFDSVMDISYFIDSTPNYRSNSKSFSAGGRYEICEQIDLSAAASLTWTHADFRGDMATGRLLSRVNEIDTRIIGLESDLDYEVVEGVEFGVGYRWQQYRDSRVQEFLDYSGTVHTVTLRATVDLGFLGSLIP